MADRTPRTTETREKTERRKGWSRPSALPTPEPRDGLHFRWIRTSTLGNSDNTNENNSITEIDLDLLYIDVDGIYYWILHDFLNY